MKSNIHIVSLVINLIVLIFLVFAGTILTLEFQKLLEGGVILRIIESSVWTLGMLMVLLKACSINWNVFYRGGRR